MIDLYFCPYIDAPCRFIKNNNPGISGKPFSHNYLLLISTGKIPGVYFHIRRLYPQIFHCLITERLLFLIVHDSKLITYHIQVGQCQIVTDTQLRTKTVLFPVFRCQNNTVSDGIHRAVYFDRFPVHIDFSALFRVRSKDRPCSLCPPGTHQACKSHDLSGVD